MPWMMQLAVAAQLAMAPVAAHAPLTPPVPLAPIGGDMIPIRSSDALLMPPMTSQLAPAEDPADSLLRVASARMSRGDYLGAAELYRATVRRYPTSMRLSEAMYYEAFALYRAGDFPRARGALDALRERYPQASARGDASALRTRVCGELARQGDSGCAEEVARVSSSAAESRGGRSAARRSSECDDNDGDEDNDSRIAALNALLQMDADRAMPILERVMARRDRCSEPLRRKAVFLIAQKQTSESASLLLDAARNDPDAMVREQAVFWLSQVNDPRAVDMLIDIVEGNGERSLRDKALFALSQHASAKATAALRSFAESPRQPVDLRDRAIFTLGQRKGPESAEYLRSLYRRLDDNSLREKVLFALSQRDDGDGAAFLLGVARDAREPVTVRKQAIFSASQTRAVSVSALSALFGSLSERELREQVIFALSQRRETAALDKLMDIARAEPDRELRKKAIFWLGQSRDPRVTAFLADLVTR